MSSESIGGVLVTGDHGFVGRYLVEAVLPRARWVAGLDRTTGPVPEHGYAGGASAADERRPQFSLVTEAPTIHLAADLTDAAAARTALEKLVHELGPPEWVVHLAAQASVGASFRDPAATYRANVVGTAVLLQTLADLAPKSRVLIAGSAHVYGPPTRPDGALDESSPLAPSTHYGLSKLAQEEMGRLFFAASVLRSLTTRAFNHIGPSQGLGFVVPDFACRLARLEAEGGGVLRVGNLTARRDYLDVRDVVLAYLTVLERGEAGAVYNVSSGVTLSVDELLHLMLGEVRVPVFVEHDPALMRPVDIPVLAGSSERLRTLGWTPGHDIRKTVRETLDHWRRRVAAGDMTEESP